MTDLVFEGQREDETVELLFRRHFTVWLPMIFPFLISIYGILGAIYFAWPKFVLYVILVLSGLCLLILAYKIVLWHYSYFILTDQRLRCIQRNGIFAQAIVDINLRNITNTQYQESGLIGAMIYKYGNINIESVSADLMIERVANARKVYNVLQDLINKKELDEEN